MTNSHPRTQQSSNARNHTDCEDLHRALKDARARLDPPQRDTSFPGAQSAVVLDPGDRTPDASADVQQDIRSLEQALRDAGCDPDADWDHAGAPDREAVPRSQYLDAGELDEDERDQREKMLRQVAESRDKLEADNVDMPAEERTIGEPVEQELDRMRSGGPASTERQDR